MIRIIIKILLLPFNSSYWLTDLPRFINDQVVLLHLSAPVFEFSTLYFCNIVNIFQQSFNLRDFSDKPSSQLLLNAKQIWKVNSF